MKNKKLDSQCIGITKKGERCKRTTLRGQEYCRQHQPKIRKLVKNISVLGIISTILALIGLFADITGVVSFLDTRQEEVNQRMTGQVRLAIAEFDVIPEGGRHYEGLEISKMVYDTISASLYEIDQNISVEVWGPSQVGIISGKNNYDRISNAANRSNEIGSDILVFGVVDTTANSWKIVPEFYIRDRGLFDVAELIGHYKFGNTISFDTETENIATRIKTSEFFEPRIELLSHVVTGLSFYSIRDYETAYNLLSKIPEEFDNETWTEIGGKELVYVLIGNAASRMNSLSDAKIAFESAIAIDNEYSRAHLGLAGVYYGESLAKVKSSSDIPNVELDYLWDAIEKYRYAGTVKNIPPLSDTESKIEFGLGQCYTLLGFSYDSNMFDNAIKYLTAVIDEYNQAGNERIRVFAGEAHGRLGLIYLYKGENNLALDEYKQALTLLESYPERYEIYQRAVDELSQSSNE